MTKLNQIADFTNKQVFVGIDVHKKSWSVSLFYEDSYVRTISQPPSVDALDKFLRREFPGANYLCGYESGFSGFWLQRQLEQRKINCQVIHPGDIPHTQKRKTAKTDTVDSKSIAQALSAGTVHSIYIPNQEIESHRLLIRHRTRVINDIHRCKNRIRGLLLQFGFTVPEQYCNSWSKKFLVWLKTFPIDQSITRTTLNHMIGQLEALRSSLLLVNKDVRLLQESEKYKPLMTLLLSIPGVGPLTAITLITEIADIKRFRSFRQLNSFVGLYPSEYSSGEHQYKGNITFRHNKYLRKMLTESAWAAIRHDPALMLTFKDWEHRMTRKRALVKTARKLLSRIRYVWLNETMYEKGVAK
jgi:transposase